MSNHPKFRTTGRVIGLWRYPVKSMAGESLTEVDVGWHGLVGDRRWAFARDEVPQSGFPWLTIRQRPEMSRYTPSFVDPDRPDKSRTVVTTPAGVEHEVTSAALARELYPDGVRTIRQDRGIFDTFPLSLISTQTIERLSARVEMPLAVERFRPNILIDSTDETPFPEDALVGRVLRIGTLLMRVDKRDGRCIVITIDPTTGVRTPEILRTVARDRDGCLGIYGTTVQPGRVAINDAVLLED